MRLAHARPPKVSPAPTVSEQVRRFATVRTSRRTQNEAQSFASHIAPMGFAVHAASELCAFVLVRPLAVADGMSRSEPEGRLLGEARDPGGCLLLRSASGGSIHPRNRDGFRLALSLSLWIARPRLNSSSPPYAWTQSDPGAR